MQDRQREGRRLAGAGLRNSDHVAAGQRDRNRLGLDGGRRDVFFFRECTREGLGEAEIVKRAQVGTFCCANPHPRGLSRVPRSRVVKDAPRVIWVCR